MNAQTVNKLLYYPCYIAPTLLDATAPSSGGSCPVPAKLHKHFNAELVIFLQLYICCVVKIEYYYNVKIF
jgi:hypothetical protein